MKEQLPTTQQPVAKVIEVRFKCILCDTIFTGATNKVRTSIPTEGFEKLRKDQAMIHRCKPDGSQAGIALFVGMVITESEARS